MSILFKSTRNNEYAFLSNFWPDVQFPQPSVVTYRVSTNLNLIFDMDEDCKDLVFHSSEHYYQYKKFQFIDKWYANNVLYPQKSAVDVKILSGKGKYCEWAYETYGGTKISHKREFDTDIQEFIQCSNLTMLYALYVKFSEPSLKRALLKTRNISLHEQGRMSTDYWAHTGKDMLGKMLMCLRRYFQTDNTPTFDKFLHHVIASKILDSYSPTDRNI
jgi:predicted NAD-dependent protein-ADP-ribosyltransferase YbiA (DUF1768 family)